MKLPHQQGLRFQALSDEQCEELYQATLECLEKVGVQVNHEEARDLLSKAGARVEANRVFIPGRIIQQAIDTAPRSFSLWNRDGAQELRINQGSVHFGPGPTCTYFHDPVTGQRRRAQRGDAGMTAHVCDALENIDYVMSLCYLDDVAPGLSPVYEFAEMISNTTKPIVAWASDPKTLSAIYQIAACVAGGEQNLQAKPNFAFFASYESPLKHLKEPLANMLWAADHNIPLVYIGGPCEGLEAPFSAASALVIHLAAALSGLAIIQLKQPGAPMMIAAVPHAMDLRTARPAYGSPEMSLNLAAATDLARYLGLPFMGTAGASESKLLDSQAAIEITIQVLMSCLSGPSLVHDVGFLDCADIGSLPLLVMTDEVIAMVKRIIRGVQVDRETIMLDLIEKVGPGGNYLSEYQSAILCRREVWVPTLMDRYSYLVWESKDGKSMEQRVNEKLQRILNEHTPAPLPDNTGEKIETILTDAESRR